MFVDVAAEAVYTNLEYSSYDYTLCLDFFKHLIVMLQRMV